MIVFVHAPSGKTLSIECNQNDTLCNFKKKYCDVINIPIHQVNLICAGKQLDDDSKLMAEYKLSQSCTLHHVLKLRGGMFHATSGK